MRHPAGPSGAPCSMRIAGETSGAVALDTGDMGLALARAATKVQAHYVVPFLAHAAMEPMNCTVQGQPDGCEIWVGTQVIARAWAAAAEVTGLPLDKVTVHNHLIGRGLLPRSQASCMDDAPVLAQAIAQMDDVACPAGGRLLF